MGCYSFSNVKFIYRNWQVLALLVCVINWWNGLSWGRLESRVEPLCLHEWLRSHRHYSTLCVATLIGLTLWTAQYIRWSNWQLSGEVRQLVLHEVTIAEASKESRLVTNFENLLNILELESTLANVVSSVQWIVNDWNSCRLIHGYLRNQIVKIVWFSHVPRFFAHYSVFMVLKSGSIIVQKVKQNISQIDVLGNSNFVEFPVLDESYDHEKKAIWTEATFVWVVKTVNFQHLFEN